MKNKEQKRPARNLKIELTELEYVIMTEIIDRAYMVMRYHKTDGLYYDNGDFMLMATTEEMNSLNQIRKKLGLIP